MAQLHSSQQHRNLSYQFFFLMRTYWWENEKRIEEPFFDSDHIQINTKGKGVRIDNDKRLFRYEVNEKPLEEWQTNLKQAWHDLQHIYHEEFKHFNKEQSDKFSQQFLLGVSLVILDEEINQHQIKVELKLDQQTISTYFQIRGESLLQVNDLANKMPSPARLHAFELHQHKQLN